MGQELTAQIKLCDYCGQPIKSGRSDRKYCSDACKSEYNNQEKRKSRELKKPEELPEFVSAINGIIIKNWRILKELLGNKDTVRIRPLEVNARGFNYKYFTSERENQYNDDIYYFCYDMGYKIIGEGGTRRVVIIKNSEMVRLSGPAFLSSQRDSFS